MLFRLFNVSVARAEIFGVIQLSFEIGMYPIFIAFNPYFFVSDQSPALIILCFQDDGMNEKDIFMHKTNVDAGDGGGLHHGLLMVVVKLCR